MVMDRQTAMAALTPMVGPLMMVTDARLKMATAAPHMAVLLVLHDPVNALPAPQRIIVLTTATMITTTPPGHLRPMAGQADQLDHHPMAVLGHHPTTPPPTRPMRAPRCMRTPMPRSTTLLLNPATWVATSFLTKDLSPGPTTKSLATAPPLTGATTRILV